MNPRTIPDAIRTAAIADYQASGESHRHVAIREHTARIDASRNTYWRENHCPCGEFVPFSTAYPEGRTCNRCKMRAAINKEISNAS